ncbi:MAG: hypothetical protein RBU37_21840, partial [Myxococcota bacterium]|nr:hypothetical protein [Myxococcota bacterium]
MTQSPNDGKAPKAGEEVGFAATMAMEAVDIPLDPASYASTLADTELPMSPEEIRALMSNPAQDETNALDNDSGATIPVSAEQAEAMLANLSAYDENAATAIVSPEQIAAARQHAGLVPNQPDDGR